MRQLEKILLATDFTKAADNALEMAIAVAKTFNSEIILIHVIPNIYAFKKSSDMVRQAADENLEKRRNVIVNNKIKVSNKHLSYGKAFDCIIKYADFHDVNLIMIGSGEKEKSDHFRLGINAHKVVRKSNKPVWVVKQDSVPVVKKVLCPVDFSLPSRRALENAIHLSRNLNAELTVLTVIQHIDNDYYAGSAVMPYEEDETYDRFEELQFNKFLQDCDFSNVKWYKGVRKGEPYNQILKAISDEGIDLLIMGTIGMSALVRVLMGSVTEKVAREVPCSIITLKSEDAIKVRLEKDLENIDEFFKDGKELMEKGFNKEALVQLQNCLNIDMDFEPAWESMAIVYDRLGKKEQSENTRIQAKRVRERYGQQKIEAELLSRYTLFGKHSL